MVNYIEYLLGKRLLFRLFAIFAAISIVFYLFDWKFLLAFWILSITIFILRKRTNSKAKNTINFFFVYVVVVFLGIIYGFTTKYYNEELDITSYFELPNIFDRTKTNIYSAEKDGIYHKIMDYIIVADPNCFQSGKPESSGGYENPNRVLLDPNGLGFVQEDIYKDGDKIKEQINYIAPLYIEKLHILYNKKSLAFKQVVQKGDYLSIGYNDSLVIDAISKSRIAVGKTGTSTKILSSILLSEISKLAPTISVKRIENATLSNALEGINNCKDFDILFFMAGQPVDKIKNKCNYSARLNS